MEKKCKVEGDEIGDNESDGGVNYVDEAVGDCSNGETAVEEKDGYFGHAG